MRAPNAKVNVRVIGLFTMVELLCISMMPWRVSVSLTTDFAFGFGISVGGPKTITVWSPIWKLDGPPVVKFEEYQHGASNGKIVRSYFSRPEGETRYFDVGGIKRQRTECVGRRLGVYLLQIILPVGALVLVLRKRRSSGPASVSGGARSEGD